MGKCYKGKKEHATIKKVIKVNDLTLKQQKASTACVNRGAKLLDKEYPGWEKKINLTKLDTSDYQCCVLGQLYGDFELGLIRLDLLDSFIEDKVSYYGFYPYDFLSNDDYQFEIKTIKYSNALWKSAIKTRRNKTKVSK